MPRKAKDETKIINEEDVKKVSSSKKVTTKKEATSAKKTTTQKESKKAVAKKTPSKKETKIENKNASTKKTSKVIKKEKIEKNDVKKKTTKKSVVKNTTSKTKTSTSKTKKVTSIKKQPTKRTSTKKSAQKKVEILEYYDLPYRYNQTVVKLLAQTPTTLFVYWDISDDDRNKYIQQYGEYFFNNTKPVLIVHNKTKNYSFEVDINDFANSWYLHSMDSDCDYQIELGRRPINEYVNISNNYLYITTSNEMESPNDHILFDKLSHFVYFKNVKTNETIKKHINLTLLNKIGKISSVQEFYKKLYPEEAIDFDRLDLKNPSSANPTSSFK